MTKYTPSVEEVRRHWGLAVDSHKREERLAEFDRMLAGVFQEGVESFAHSLLKPIPASGIRPKIHNPYEKSE